MVKLAVNLHEITNNAVLIDEPITGPIVFSNFGMACDGRFGSRQGDFGKYLVRFPRRKIRLTY